jgi:hypothetical protein
MALSMAAAGGRFQQADPLKLGAAPVESCSSYQMRKLKQKVSGPLK